MIYAMIALIGTIFIPFFSTSLEMFVAGGILQGIPWGIFQTLAVTYAADICPTSLRAYMTSVSPMRTPEIPTSCSNSSIVDQHVLGHWPTHIIRHASRTS